MPINLTTSQTLTNGTRLVISRKRWDEDVQVITYEVAERTAVGGTPPDAIVSQLAGEIRGPTAAEPNGFATVIGKNVAPVAGSPLTALLQYKTPITVDASQFAAALAALKGTAAQFEAHLLTRYLDATLAGT